MDSRHLKQFVQLAETLHFGRAGEALGVSASVLSRNIRQLEAELGSVLFDRDNRSVALTHAGSLFLDYARTALGEWDAIRSELQKQSGELHGEISIWCSVTASYSFLFELLSDFRSDHPQIEVKLHTGDPEHAISRVQNNSEDISIGARPDVLPAGLAFKPVAVSPLVFIAAKGHVDFPKPGKKRFSKEAWDETPMIMSESGLARRRLDEWFAGQELVPSIYAQVAGNEAIVSMVSLGFGVGVVPKIVLDNSPLADTVELLPVQPQLQAYEVGLFTLERKLRSPIIAAFWSAAGQGSA